MRKKQILLTLLLNMFLVFLCFSSPIPDMIIEDKHQQVAIKELIHNEGFEIYFIYGNPDSLEKNRKKLDQILDVLKEEGLLDKML